LYVIAKLVHRPNHNRCLLASDATRGWVPRLWYIPTDEGHRRGPPTRATDEGHRRGPPRGRRNADLVRVYGSHRAPPLQVLVHPGAKDTQVLLPTRSTSTGSALSTGINASRLSDRVRPSEQLQKALDSRVVIEHAKGITAERSPSR